MANENAAAGAKPIGSLGSDDISINKYTTASSDSTPIYIGDFVSTSGVFDANGIPICRKSDPGEITRGIVTSVDQTEILSNPGKNYREAGTVRILHVCDDPFVLFSIQCNGILTTSDSNLNANITLGTPNDSTGLSGTMLDVSSLSESNSQLKVIRVEEIGNNYIGEANTKVICLINRHEFREGFSSESDSFQAYKRTTGVAQVQPDPYTPLAWYKLTFSGFSSPSGFSIDSTNRIITCNAPGRYKLQGFVYGTAQYNLLQSYGLYAAIRKNDVTLSGSVGVSFLAGGIPAASKSIPIQESVFLERGDKLDVSVKSENQGFTIGTTLTGGTETYVAFYLSGNRID